MMIYVNGDSYSCISDGLRYSEVLGEHFKCDVINSAIAGSSNNRIIRTSIRELIQLRKQHDEIFAIISVSFPLRTELWDTDLSDNRFINDGEFTSFQTSQTKHWFQAGGNYGHSKYKDYINQWLRWYNIEAETVKLLQEIILLASWCKQNNIRYVIFSGALQEPVDITAPFICDFYDEMSNDKNIINIFQDSFTAWCVRHGHKPIDNFTQEIHGRTYDIGHHGEQAHRAFANYLMENYLHEI